MDDYRQATNMPLPIEVCINRFLGEVAYRPCGNSPAFAQYSSRNAQKFATTTQVQLDSSPSSSIR
jgi:hypothetical protein